MKTGTDITEIILQYVLEHPKTARGDLLDEIAFDLRVEAEAAREELDTKATDGT